MRRARHNLKLPSVGVFYQEPSSRKRTTSTPQKRCLSPPTSPCTYPPAWPPPPGATLPPCRPQSVDSARTAPSTSVPSRASSTGHTSRNPSTVSTASVRSALLHNAAIHGKKEKVQTGNSHRLKERNRVQLNVCSPWKERCRRILYRHRLFANKCKDTGVHPLVKAKTTNPTIYNLR